MSIAITDGTRPINILLVDDDDGEARAVQRAFAKARIVNPFLRAVDGLDALDILRGSNGKAKPDRPFMMLVDLNMPRMNGIELVTAMRADPDLHKIVVFMLSTSHRDEDLNAAYALNVAGYIVKENAGEGFLKLTSLIESYWRVVEMP